MLPEVCCLTVNPAVPSTRTGEAARCPLAKLLAGSPPTWAQVEVAHTALDLLVLRVVQVAVHHLQAQWRKLRFRREGRLRGSGCEGPAARAG